ncbi:MAG: GDSL-type esterase/lipase family protein [Pirellulales bacterium]
MNAHRYIRFAAAFNLIFFAATAHAGIFTGLGAMGDSGTERHSVENSWVPVLEQTCGLNFGPGSSYNFAVGGSTISRLIGKVDQDGQIASLVAAGEVTVPILLIGGKDFGNPRFRGLLDGTTPPSEREEIIESATENIKTAVDTVLAEDPEGFILFSVPEIGLAPVWREITGGDPALEDFVSSSVAMINDELRIFAVERKIAFVDIAATRRDFLTPGFFELGGVTIDTVNQGQGTNFFNDRLHPSSIGNGILANLVMTALNDAYKTDLELLSDLEILELRGLEEQYTGETFSSVADFSPYVVFVPESSSWLMMILA